MAGERAGQDDQTQDAEDPAQDDLEQSTWVRRDETRGEHAHVRACTLEVLEGPDAGKRVRVAAQRLRIGRERADLELTDKRVSALHAEIELDARGYRLRDLGSTNGTFVAGVRVLDAYLPRDAVISVGDDRIRFGVEAGSLALPLHDEPRLAGMLGRSPVMRRLFADLDRIAATDATVLITGETGVGKERVAEAIHERSARSAGPFVVLDCGAVPPQLFEAQLFGHEQGAFTDAKKAAPGVFELAEGGTVFLDEIGELPLELQSRLLRVVETRTVRRLGGQRTRELDVRVLAATNRDLAAEVNRHTFRTDLYYRLSVVEVHVPPLRERSEDVELLVEHFRAELDPKGRGTLPADFLEWAKSHPWPGNVRQLRNAVERALTLGPSMSVPPPPAANASPIDLGVPFREAKQRVVDDFDRRYITALLSKHQGNVSAAARAAGLDRMSIYKAIQRLGLADDTRER
jgi:transcriptional regulator with PAS, ATPase and Fis domain